MPDSHNISTLGIVFALDIETHGLRRALSHAKRLRTADPRQIAWQVGAIRVMIEISGMGRERCEESTRRLINQGARCMISAGLAASLDTKPRIGDVVVVDSVALLGSDNAPLQCNPSLIATAPPSERLSYTIWRSDLVTSDSLISQASSKAEIYRNTGMAALDMESYALAETCELLHIPFVVIKGISDTADQDLPDEVEALAASETWVKQYGILLKRPQLWLKLWQLRGNALLAADNLGDVIGMMLLRMTTTPQDY